LRCPRLRGELADGDAIHVDAADHGCVFRLQRRGELPDAAAQGRPLVWRRLIAVVEVAGERRERAT
jgi:hypothetical protein